MAVQDDLACQELVEVITEYLEGMLPPVDRVRFEQHLESCRGCRNYVEQMRQTIRLTGRLKENTVPPEAKQTLLELFRDWKLPKTGR